MAQSSFTVNIKCVYRDNVITRTTYIAEATGKWMMMVLDGVSVECEGV